jgi:hypothetical protein
MVKMIVINRVSYLIFFSFCCISGMAQGSNGTNAGALYTEPATLISLGFEWSIEGDDNRNAKTQIFYRKAGSTEWQEGPPMLRIGDERINENALQYVTPRMFAGSLFDLAPDTRYVVRLIMTDSDGITGNTEQLVSVSTRGEPTPATDGNTYHVYPPSYEGQRIEPAYTGLLGAYYTGYSGSDNFNTYPPRVRPGDTLLVHAGVYQDNRYSYQGGLGTISSGSYFLTAKGTAERPIVIKSAGDGEVIFDGDGAYNLFNVMAADHHYF